MTYIKRFKFKDAGFDVQLLSEYREQIKIRQQQRGHAVARKFYAWVMSEAQKRGLHQQVGNVLIEYVKMYGWPTYKWADDPFATPYQKRWEEAGGRLTVDQRKQREAREADRDRQLAVETAEHESDAYWQNVIDAADLRQRRQARDQDEARRRRREAIDQAAKTGVGLDLVDDPDQYWNDAIARAKRDKGHC